MGEGSGRMKGLSEKHLEVERFAEKGFVEMKVFFKKLEGLLKQRFKQRFTQG
jgi:hypothetical protein